MTLEVISNTRKVTLTENSLRTHTKYSFICLFNSPDTSVGAVGLYQEDDTFPEINTIGLTTSGAVNWFDRDTASNSSNLTGLTDTLDDSNWHWLFCVKRSNIDREMFVDWVSDGTSTNNSTEVGPVVSWGIGVGGDGPFGARLKRHIRLPGIALSLAEARHIAINGPGSKRYSRTSTWYDLTGISPEKDFFNNGRPAPLVGYVPGGNAPCKKLFVLNKRLITFVPPAPLVVGLVAQHPIRRQPLINW